MDVKWVKIRAWHAVKQYLEGGTTRTHCGLVAATDYHDDLPAERSCESCLRILARLSDA